MKLTKVTLQNILKYRLNKWHSIWTLEYKPSSITGTTAEFLGTHATCSNRPAHSVMDRQTHRWWQSNPYFSLFMQAPQKLDVRTECWPKENLTTLSNSTNKMVLNAKKMCKWKLLIAETKKMLLNSPCVCVWGGGLTNKTLEVHMLPFEGKLSNFTWQALCLTWKV